MARTLTSSVFDGLVGAHHSVHRYFDKERSAAMAPALLPPSIGVQLALPACPTPDDSTARVP